jgi:hypothetical protein
VTQPAVVGGHEDGGLGGAVDAAGGDGHGADDGTDVDDGAAIGTDVFDGSLGGEKQAEHVDTELFVEVLGGRARVFFGSER